MNDAPYLGSLVANAAIIGIVTGFGELAGYGLRLLSGPIADVTGRFWPLMIAIGISYDYSVYAAVTFCVLAELAAVPMFVWVGRRYRPHRPS
ncbi:MAG: hypothetical protein ACREUL_08285 [Steroidobacteraceae bacterium]